MKISLLLFIVICTSFKAQVDQIIPAPDNVLVHCKLYESKEANPKIMLLCHQARFSKGEYIETAPKFNKLGYTCLAIDQRSGEGVNKDINQTALMAKQLGLGTDFEDAETDIRTAIYFLYSKYNQKITLLGSSYSSALIIKIAATEKDKVEAIISFSPGEYFKDTTIINTNLKKLDIPIWITCAKNEILQTETLFKGVENKRLLFFKPEKEGKHGSKALWENYKDNKEYWESLKQFLNKK